LIEDVDVLGCDIMWTGNQLQVFQRNVPFSSPKRRRLPTNPHGITTQKINTFVSNVLGSAIVLRVQLTLALGKLKTDRLCVADRPNYCENVCNSKRMERNDCYCPTPSPDLGLSSDQYADFGPRLILCVSLMGYDIKTFSVSI
jgi:hypothetical protein